MGSDANTRLAGQQQLLDFTKCTDLKHLASHLDSWYHLLESYGSGIDEEMRKVLLLKVIPNGMRDAIVRRDELKRMPILDLIEWMKQQVSWMRSQTLAEHYAK